MGGGGDDDGFLNPESDLPSNRSLRDSDWSKERSAQQLELSDVRPRNDSGLCDRILLHSIQTLHVVNFGCGFAAVVYGSLLVSKFDEPAMASAMFCLIVGTIHLSTSSVGMFSYFGKWCRRFGLKMSGVVGPYVSFVYLTIIVTLAADEGGFLGYLDDNKEVREKYWFYVWWKKNPSGSIKSSSY